MVEPAGAARGRLRVILGDQLSRGIASLDGIDPATDIVLMAEVVEEATYVRHHPKKIAFLFSAMRHFAAALAAEGLTVDYVRLDDPDNSGTLSGEVARAAARHDVAAIVATAPGEWRVEQAMLDWQAALGRPVTLREDGRFLCSRQRFAAWAAGRRVWRMEHFYRDMRRETGFLMDGDAPIGGQWNFDADNRKPLPSGLEPPPLLRVVPDAVTADVLALVRERFADHFGSLEDFWFGVTADDAARALDHFIDVALPRFGDYQDAMRHGMPTVFHSVLSLYMNAGLLDPRHACAAAEAAWHRGAAPLAAVEGFIRQILGWREYVRGVYWQNMPGYGSVNALGAQRPLPSFYWTGKTELACLKECIDQTRDLAYAHHIQRLMVLGNFALLAGSDPRQVQEWYLVVYADAYEWVEMPNVVGMALYADGGLMASKPYAASARYIDRMSDYCDRCPQDPRQQTGPSACPFNFLYWDFIARNRQRLAGNRRMAVILGSLDRLEPARLAAMRAEADRFLNRLDEETRQWAVA